MSCLFCRIIAGEVPASLLHEDERVVAFQDANPQAPTHVLLVPRRHIEKLSDLEPDDAALVGEITLVATRLAERLGIETSGYRLVVNCGRGAGQSVWHLHFHLLGGRAMRWPPG